MAIRKTRRQMVMDAGSIAALYASGWGPRLAPVAVASPVLSVNGLLREYVDTLTADLSPDALHQTDAAAMLRESFSLASVWSDLCDLAGEPVPADVGAVLDAPEPEDAGLTAFFSLGQGEYRRHLRFTAARDALIALARDYRDGAVDDAALGKGAFDLLCDAWKLGEDKGLNARIAEYHEARA